MEMPVDASVLLQEFGDLDDQIQMEAPASADPAPKSSSEAAKSLEDGTGSDLADLEPNEDALLGDDEMEAYADDVMVPLSGAADFGYGMDDDAVEYYD